MVALLAPGKMLLNHLSYPRKFFLVSMLLVVPLVLAIALLFSETMPRIRFAESELAGRRYLEPLHALLEHAVEDEMITRQNIEANADANVNQAQSRARIEADIAALHQIDAEVGQLLETTPSLNQMTQEWNKLRDTQFSTTEATNTEYKTFIASIRGLIAHVGDRSNLILDPELTSYYLMDAVLLKLPEQTALLGSAAREAERVSQGAVTDTRDLEATIGLVRQNSQSVQQGLTVAFTTTPAIKQDVEAALVQHQQASESYAQLLDTIVGSSQNSVSLQEQRERAQAVQAANNRLWQQSAQELDRLLQGRVNALQLKNTSATSAAFVLLLVVLYLLASFYRSVMDVVDTLERAARRMAEGEIGAQVTVKSRDELSAVVGSFNTVAAALVASAREREAAEAERVRMHEQVIQAQRTLLHELAAPLIPITDDVIVLPLIGHVDAERIEHLRQTLANGIASSRIRVVIVDITGVSSMSSDVAYGLVQAAQTARLLGAQFVVTGMRASVAQALTTLDANLEGIKTFGTLSSGVAGVLG